MVCYSIVLGAAIVVHGLRNKVQNRLPHAKVLSLLLWGGSIALVIDHLLNGELFLLGGNLAWDLLLGSAMTIGIFIIWALYVAVTRSASRPLRA